MPSPSSYVEPSVKSFEPSAGVYAATMSGFITKPPAATITDRAAITPCSSKLRHPTPTTAPSSDVTRLVTPVS